MATKAQIDAGVAILVAALDVKDASGKNVSTFNGRVVPAWNELKNSINVGLPQLRAVGIDPTQAVALLTQVVDGINPAGQALRALLNQLLSMVPSDVPAAPTGLTAKVS